MEFEELKEFESVDNYVLQHYFKDKDLSKISLKYQEKMQDSFVKIIKGMLQYRELTYRYKIILYNNKLYELAVM